MNRANRLIVRSDLNEGVGLQIPHFRRFITTGREHFRTVVGPAAAENGRVVLLRGLEHRLSIRLDFPTANVVRPRTADQISLRHGQRRKSETRYRIVGRRNQFGVFRRGSRGKVEHLEREKIG